MRILFTTTSGSGHFSPVARIAHAAVDAGHDVAVACPLGFLPTVEQAGFTAFPAGYNSGGISIFDAFPGGNRLPEEEQGTWWVQHIYIEVEAAVMTPNLLNLSRQWPPDLIVRETCEYGGCVAAEMLGIPHASVRSDAYSSSYTRRHAFAAPLAALRERCGLPLDPDVIMPFRYLHLAGEPRDFLLPGDTPAPTRHIFRPIDTPPADATLPDWIGELPDRPTVYATLGTFVSGNSAGQWVFPALLEALRDEPYNVILTVGRRTDPAQFGPQPPNVHIEQFIPQGLLLPHCDLVFDHGGFGTVVGALTAGLPQVIIPLIPDQPRNAACCAKLGAGRVLGSDERTPEAIRRVVGEVFADASYRTAAEQARDEMAALPGPEYAVVLLERLAAEKQPLVTI